MIYARGLFDLQLRFAERVSQLSRVPLPRAVLEYTNLYIRLGLGRAFDPDHPTWQEFVAGLPEAADRVEWTYRFYLRRPDAMPSSPVVATRGCFSYSRTNDGRVRLHFENAETDGRSPLAIERQGQRRADLSALFAHVRRAMESSITVVGASWLYNLEAYRRLFPPPYVATARVLPQRFRYMPLWGQFVDRRGDVRAPAGRQFLARLERSETVDDLDRCFPLPVLGVEAPASEFYRFYGL